MAVITSTPKIASPALWRNTVITPTLRSLSVRDCHTGLSCTLRRT